MSHNPTESIIERSELMAKCHHENKFMLSNYIAKDYQFIWNIIGNLLTLLSKYLYIYIHTYVYTVALTWIYIFFCILSDIAEKC